MDGGLDKTKIFSSQSDMDGGLDKTKIFSSQSDMVGWTKQRFSHHKVTWWARQNKDFLITK
jgi:hypothetical protein